MIEEIKKEKPKAPEMPKSETIEIPKKLYDSLQERMKRLERDTELLISVADKRALARHFARQREGKVPIIKLREIDGQIVLGWKSSKDIVEKRGARPKDWYEEQRTILLLEDGSKKEMIQKDFELQHKKVACRRMGIVTDDITGKVAYRLVRLDNGKEYTIGEQFVN